MQRTDPVVNAFYKSSAWIKCRKSYIASKYGLCERCGEPGKYVHHKKYITSNNIHDPSITLSWSNLELLCIECHNNEHFGRGIDYEFDALGNLIKNDTIKINKAL